MNGGEPRGQGALTRLRCDQAAWREPGGPAAASRSQRLCLQESLAGDLL